MSALENAADLPPPPRVSGGPNPSVFAEPDFFSRIKAIAPRAVDISGAQSLQTIATSGSVVVVQSRIDGADALLQRLAEQSPETPVLLVGDAVPVTEVRSLMRLAASDILVASTPAEQIVDRVAKISDELRTKNHVGGQCWAFTGAVGGAGVTTLAIETAFALARRPGAPRVALVDLNLTDGMTAAYVDGERKLDVTEVCRAPHRLDATLLAALSWNHPSGVTLFAAPRDYEAEQVATEAGVLALLDAACSAFDYVIVDVPRHRKAWSDAIFSVADQVMVISELTIPSLHCAAYLASDIESKRDTGPDVRIVLNRMIAKRRSRHAIPLDRAEKAIGRNINATISSDWDSARAAVNLGVPIFEAANKSALVKDIQSLTDIFAPQERIAANDGGRR